MLYEFLCVLYFINCIFLIFIVLRQRSHGGFWSGQSSNDSTVIFGGNSGADILQKITWFCGTFLIFGTFFLSIYKTNIAKKTKYTSFIEKNKKKEIQENLEIDKNLEEKSEDSANDNDLKKQ